MTYTEAKKRDFIRPEELLNSIDISKVEGVVREVAGYVEKKESLGEYGLAKIIGRANKGVSNENAIGKRHLHPVFVKMKARGEFAHLSDGDIKKLSNILKMKPSRTVSGVATVSILAKPHPCRGNCIFCPNDLRMPKSYLYDEPACMRAERCFFDPYLQVTSRMQMLENMGHSIDKIEMLILGSTWHDYPVGYRTWFIEQVFEAVNDFGIPACAEKIDRIRKKYSKAGFHCDQDRLEAEYKPYQDLIASGTATYAQAYKAAYVDNDSAISRRWKAISEDQVLFSTDALLTEQVKNETAQHRIVGMSIETRPDAVSVQSLCELRLLGVTKVQMGVQSTDDEIASLNGRAIPHDTVRNAVELLRAFGFKLHLHFMANLYGSNVEKDKCDFENFIESDLFCPDELKIYPCALIGDTELVSRYEDGLWRPYSDDELKEVLEYDLSLVKPYTRVSRVIRDFCTEDIIDGNKTVNMRQIVSDDMKSKTGKGPVDIRSREVKKMNVDVDMLRLEEIEYATSMSDEVFLQFVDDQDHIAGFLRLSFPYDDYVKEHLALPVSVGDAMIREVHVYGNVAGLQDNLGNVQHKGLGTQLVLRACDIARNRKCDKIRVISSVGTRKYYERFGFKLDGLYQVKDL